MAKAEKEFNELSVRERKKWVYDVTGSRRKRDHEGLEASLREQGPQMPGDEFLVVTLAVCGKQLGNVGRKPVRSAAALDDELERFASQVLTKRGSNIMAVDVAWSPDSERDFVSREELVKKWPDLFYL